MLNIVLNNSHKILKIQFARVLFACACLFMTACSSFRHTLKNECLLDENAILNNKTEVATDEIASYIRQQPNKYLVSFPALKIKLFPYHLWLYQSIDQQKMQQAREIRDKKYDKINEQRVAKAARKNEKRQAKGKHIKTPKLKDKTSPTWRESWVQNGEPPAVLDSSLIRISKSQIQKFLVTKGYFRATVTDSVALNKSHTKAKVFYKLNPGDFSQIHDITYVVEDPFVEYFVLQDTVNCLVKRGMRYDVDVLTRERERITRQLRDNGYYKFGSEYIFILIDTNLAGNLLNVEFNIKKYAYHPENDEDTLLFSYHQRYKIGNIYFITDYDMFNKNKVYKDTADYEGFKFLYNNKMAFRKKDIARKVFFYEGEIFNYDKIEDTYTRLSTLKAFKSTTINFKENSKDKTTLNTYILMSPMYRQNFSIETEGTNTSGNLGVAASIVYQNRNIFRGSELLQIKINGGLIAQKNFESSSTISESNSDNAYILPFLQAFNTVQFGPQINLNFPKPLFPFTLFKFYPNASPVTIASASMNFQQNVRYTRALTNFSYGLQFNGKKYIKHYIVPFEANLIKAYLSGDFDSLLDQSKNFYLKRSFTSHITTVSRYTFIYNNQQNAEASPNKTFTYFKFDFESSGNALRGLYNITNQPKDSLGSYHILNVPFAQFLRFDVDQRFYKTVRKLGRFVFRYTGGMGYALANLNTLPYEKSFFGGGPNDIRAWRARTLGPGGYNQKNDQYYDKIGDIQIEFNFEYRFNIYKWLNGAWFVDAGNIWLRQKDPTRPLADFEWNRFYKEIATGTGVGLRADFSFFILRLDGAFQVYNPAMPEGKERWMFGGGDFYRSFVANFGIGYPF